MSECQWKNVTNQWSSESNQPEEKQFVFGTLNNDNPVYTNVVLVQCSCWTLQKPHYCNNINTQAMAIWGWGGIQTWTETDLVFQRPPMLTIPYSRTQFNSQFIHEGYPHIQTRKTAYVGLKLHFGQRDTLTWGPLDIYSQTVLTWGTLDIYSQTRQ